MARRKDHTRDQLREMILSEGHRHLAEVGYSGFSAAGTSGFSGYSGLGTSGFSGFSGTSGYSGFSGGSGYSGFSGPSVEVVHQFALDHGGAGNLQLVLLRSLQQTTQPAFFSLTVHGGLVRFHGAGALVLPANCSTMSLTTWMSIGLASTSFIPDCKQRSRSSALVLAVSPITGSCATSGRAS